MPKISVITAAYNAEKYLPQSLDSIVNQTLRDIEIICVEDCSSDNTLSILQEYAAKDDRIVILQQSQNGGCGKAWNCALDVAKGDYVMFVDADDWLELTACEEAYNQITKYNNDFVFFNFQFYDNEKQTYKVDTRRLERFKNDWNNPHIKFYELDYPFFGNGECWYKIYNRAFLDKHHIRFFEERFGDDLYFYAQLLVNTESASILNKVLYNYRIHESNSTKKLWYKELLLAQKECFDYCLKSKHPQLFSKFYAIAYINSLLYWFRIYVRMDRSIEKEFYSKIRDVFIRLDKMFGREEIKKYLNSKTYDKYDAFIRYSWVGYKIYRLLGIKLPFKAS